jgi:small subunit ribosomal protein S21
VVTITRKDDNESLENMIRRFNRRVQQAGTIAQVRSKRYFEKAPNRRERRKQAIIRNARKQQKYSQQRRG